MKARGTLLAAGYGMAASLVILPLSDALVQILPFRLGDLQWRFGAVGLLSTELLVPLLGLSSAVSLALFAQHRRILRRLSIGAAFGALFLAALGAVFVFTVLQMRELVAPGQMESLNLTSMHALLKIGLVASVASLLALGAWKASRTGGTVGEPTVGIVVASSEARLPHLDT